MTTFIQISTRYLYPSFQINAVNNVAGVAALMAQAGVESALFNVEINLGSIKDQSFASNVSEEIASLQKKTIEKTNTICALVQQALK